MVRIAVASGLRQPANPETRPCEGHRVFVLTVTYAGARTRQFSVRRERLDEVRRWLDNYQRLKEGI
jgi:hypothetical protein